MSKGYEFLTLSFTSCSTQNNGPCTSPGHTVELALEVWVLVSHPDSLRTGDLTFPPANGSPSGQVGAVLDKGEPVC